VLELSSFQLMTMRKSPKIAVLTNLAPNHLDVHKDYAEYIAAKENNFTHQSTKDIAVFNADNADSVTSAQKAVGRVRWFSRQKELKEGVFLRGSEIMVRHDGTERVVMTIGDIKLPGVHNIENYMAAIAAVDGIVPDKCVRAVARRFTGVEHRIELVRELDGVKYYNDSIGTSPTRTMACLDSFDQKLILIAGGYDKGVPFTQLGVEMTKKVKTLVLCGATAPAIRKAVEEAPGYAECGMELVETQTLAEAVAAARKAGQPGDVVVLSPACAAFDQFKNFMERGKVFKRLVSEL